MKQVKEISLTKMDYLHLEKTLTLYNKKEFFKFVSFINKVSKSKSEFH